MSHEITTKGEQVYQIIVNHTCARLREGPDYPPPPVGQNFGFIPPPLKTQVKTPIPPLSNPRSRHIPPLSETVKGHHEVFKPEGKKIPDFCAQKSQTRGLVWVTRGPIETIFVKTIFKIRVKKFCPSLPAT